MARLLLADAVQWRQQYGHRPRTDVEDLVRAAKSPTIRPRGASYGLKGPSYFTEGGSEPGASVQLDPPILSKPGGAGGPLQGAMPPPEPAPEAPRSLGPLRKGWGQLAPWLSRGSHDASSATPGAREVPSYAMESPFEGVAPYNVLSNPVAAGPDRIPALYTAGSRGRDAPAPPPAGAEPSLRSEDYNPCVVSSDSGLAVGHQESAAEVSQGEIPLHQRAGTVLLKRPRQGQPSGVPGEDYLAALQGPLRHADAVMEPAQAAHAPVRAMEHSVVDPGVAVDAEDVAKQQRKQEILSAVTLSAYSLEGLDPEWQAQLRQLDARLAARRLPCLSDTERAIAIRSLVVATSNARPEQAMEKALSDVLLNRRAHQLMRNGALQR